MTQVPRLTPGASALGTLPAAADRGSFRFVSGLAAPGAAAPSPAGGWIELVEGSWRRQAEAVYDAFGELLGEAGGVGAILRLHLYQQDKRFFPVLEAVRQEKEGATPAPSSGIGLRTLHGESVVRYEADAIGLSAAGSDRYGDRGTIAAGDAGASASYYSQVSRLGPYIFLAGFIPIDPVTHALVGGFSDVEPEGRFLERGRSHPDSRTGPIAAQTWVLYQRILSTLRPLAIGPEGVVNATVFLSNPADASDFLRVHSHVFGADGPALQLVVVDEVGHKGCLIEIEVTAVEGLRVRRHPAGAGTEAPLASTTGELGFVSDCLGFDGEGRLPETVAEVEADETTHALLRAIVAQAPPQDEPAVVQTWVALANLRLACDRAGLSEASIGHLWLRLRRPCAVTWAEQVLRAWWSTETAVTVSEVLAIPQCDAARAAVSASCAGLG